MSESRRPADRMKTFLRQDEGAAAILFAVAIIPIIIAVGIGIDLSRAMSSRTNLQDAMDATALAVAHLPSNTSQADLEAKANTWLFANLHDGNLKNTVLTASKVNGQVVLQATGKVDTTIAAITGVKEMPLNVRSTVKWGLNHAEVVLVLDNTGSMAGTKLERLKTAAKDLVATLENQVGAAPGVLKVGVVPFSMTVRLGGATTELDVFKDATWMSGVMPAEYGRDLFSDKDGVQLTNVNRFTLFTDQGQPWGGCVEMRAQPYDIQDTAPASNTPKSLFVPYFAPDEPDKDALKKPGNNNGYYSSANNYIADVKDDGDAKDKVGNNRFNRWLYMQGYAPKYKANKVKQSVVDDGKGPNAGCNLQPLQRLTGNLTPVKTLLNQMNASGNTNIPMGLMWGWHLLSPNLPFADGAVYSDKKTKKFLVLLTDGDNVANEYDNPNNSTYSSIGYAWQKRMAPMDENAAENARTVHMDQRMALLCSNIKASGITLYAVRIDMSGTAPKALSDCASETSMFYDINSTGLSAAFQEIAGSIGKLRIAE